MKKLLLLIAIVLLVAAASGFNWIWQSFDSSGKYSFEFSGTDSVKIVNPAVKADSTGETPGVLEVLTGNQFSLTLDSNSSTGYQWQLAKPLDAAVLELVSKKYLPPVTEAVGAGGKEQWLFHAVGKGTTDIALKYVRPWEANTPPSVTKDFTVIVSGESSGPAPAPVSNVDITTVVGATVTFTISQPVVPGGEWKFAQPLDESILKLIDDKTVTTEGVVGAVARVFTFRAVGAGLTTVYLENNSNQASFTAQVVGK